ncbi:MAG: caspase family protein [Pseudomonadota bacterium]
MLRYLVLPLAVVHLLFFGWYSATIAQELHDDGRKLALVIGNSAYRNAPPLTNPSRDAETMQRAFQVLGFEVLLYKDLNRIEFERVVLDFLLKAQNATIAAFYFAGHAVQVHGHNYLLPIDTPKFQSITYLNRIMDRLRLDNIIRDLEQISKTRLFFIDACRDNPIADELYTITGLRSTSARGGLAAGDVAQVSRGTVISYATRPGAFALDGPPNANSPYVAALKEAILTPGEDIGILLRSVTRNVREVTLGEQIPVYNVILEDKVILRPAGVQTAGSTQSAAVQLPPARANTDRSVEATGLRICSARSPDDGKACLILGDGQPIRDRRSDGTPCPQCPELVLIPAGNFSPIGADTDPALARMKRRITKPFFMGRAEVTFDQWAACVDNGGCNGYQPEDNRWGRGQRPVINVSFEDARAFVTWLSRHTNQKYDLPTEALWSYAARGPVQAPWSTGQDISYKQANFDDRMTASRDTPDAFRSKTILILQSAVTAWGLFNVHGNVREWTASCWPEVGIDPSLTPVESAEYVKLKGGDCSRRAVRGGGWDSEKHATLFSTRRASRVDRRSDDLGFRIMRYVN